MPKMTVLTDSETASGFRLAGVEVHEATIESAQATLEGIISSNEYGLVVVDEGLIEDPNKATERAMRGRNLPVIMPLPGLGSAFDEEADDAAEYMKNLVRSAIGFDIKLE